MRQVRVPTKRMVINAHENNMGSLFIILNEEHIEMVIDNHDIPEKKIGYQPIIGSSVGGEKLTPILNGPTKIQQRLNKRI